MSELLTESFCERCGTRYTFESGEPETRRPSIKKARVLARGLKHFVLSDDSLETALAEGERDEDRERAALQLEAFHQTFNFCMDCRQYTCRDCWNDAEGRCLSCAPAPGRIESAIVSYAPAPVDGPSRLDALLGPGPMAPPAIEAWPLDARFALPAGEAMAAPAAIDDAEPAAAEPDEAEPVATEPAPMVAAAETDEPEAAGEAVEAPIEPVPAAVPEPKPVPEWLAVEPQQLPRAPSLEEYLLAASAAQAAQAARRAPDETPEPETEPEAVPAAEAEPAVAPVAATVPEPEPEPVAAAVEQSEPEAVTPEAEAQPEPVAAAAPAAAPIFTPPPGGDIPRSTTRLPGWDMVAPDQGGQQPPPLPHLTASPDVRPAPWFAARTNASIWDASSADVVSRPGSAGVQACVSCGLPLSAAAHFCRRCGARQTV